MAKFPPAYFNGTSDSDRLEQPADHLTNYAMIAADGSLMGPDGAISVGAGNVVVMPGTPTFSYAGKTSSLTITVPDVAVGVYDFIGDILPGMNFIDGAGATHNGVVASVDVGTRVVTMTVADTAIVGWGMFGRDWTFTVPDGIEVVYASFCGGGGGGGGGSVTAGGTNGGGGGGGASASYVDYPLYVTPGEVLSICVGSGANGGAAGATAAGNGGLANTYSIATVISGLVASGDSAQNIRTDLSIIPKTSKGQIIPIAQPSNGAATRATAGGAAISGKGGDGGVLVNGVVSVAGGAASASNANHGAPALFKGAFGTTGGSGSSGTASSGTSGEGGSDGLHTDHSVTTAANLGGSGGSSQFGKGGNIGIGDIGGYGRGYGAGGGGGGASFAGGKGAPGIVILRY